MSKEDGLPYKAFGDRIKFLREQWRQSIREVSLSLEIDVKNLEDIESGKALPEHETLDMLISHFLLTEDQADDLRDLVDFDGAGQNSFNLPAGIEDIMAKQMVMYLPIDNKVVYTDAMHANVNDHGVILQFMQQIPNIQQPTIVSRVGMSREHAEKVIEVLTQTLKQYDANSKKQLPAPDSDKKSKNSEA